MSINRVGDNEPFSAVYLSAIANANNDRYVVSGCALSRGTGSRDLNVSKGAVYVGPDTRVSVAGTTLTVDSNGNAVTPRVDIVTVDSAGTVSLTKGDTTASRPIAPDIPDNEVLLGALLFDAGESDLDASDIYDYRIIRDSPTESEAIQSGFILANSTYAVDIVNVGPGETLSVTEATMVRTNGTAVPSGVSLVMGTLDSSGDLTETDTLVTGNGAAVYYDYDVGTKAYTNPFSVSAVKVLIALKNETSESFDAFAGYTGWASR